VSYLFGFELAWSNSKLWSAVPGRHASSPRSTTTAEHDVPATRSRWSSLVIRDTHSESVLEATVSERQAFLCNCRYPNRRGIHVQPGLASATASLENHRFCLGLQPGVDDS